MPDVITTDDEGRRFRHWKGPKPRKTAKKAAVKPKATVAAEAKPAVETLNDDSNPEES